MGRALRDDGDGQRPIPGILGAAESKKPGGGENDPEPENLQEQPPSTDIIYYRYPRVCYPRCSKLLTGKRYLFPFSARRIWSAAVRGRNGGVIQSKVLRLLESRYFVLVSLATFLVATSNHETALNASEPPSVAQKVREILLDTTGDDGAFGRGDTIAGRIEKLEILGRDALPHVTEMIPQLGTTSLVAAAWLLADAGYESSADSLAARLESPLEDLEEGWDSWNPRYAILRALGRLGGDRQAPIVEGVLKDTSRHGAVRRQALATLVSIGTARTVAMASRFIDETPPRPLTGWRPPFAVDDLSRK